MNLHKFTVLILFTAFLIHLHAAVCAMITRTTYEAEKLSLHRKVDAINKILSSVSDLQLQFNFSVSTQS